MDLRMDHPMPTLEDITVTHQLTIPTHMLPGRGEQISFLSREVFRNHFFNSKSSNFPIDNLNVVVTHIQCLEIQFSQPHPNIFNQRPDFVTFRWNWCINVLNAI